MMVSKRFPLVLLLLFSLGIAFFACQKEESSEQEGPGPNPPATVEMTKSSVQGRVLDEKQEPVRDADVFFGSEKSTTDINGYFKFDNVNVPKNTALVLVLKTGYFNGSRTFLASANSLKYVQIQLLPKTEAGKFDATAGGQVAVPNCQLIFQPKQVLNSNNEPYTGKVSVLLNLINPEDSRFADIQPGALRGTNKDGKEVGLLSYGMLGAELKGANGEELHIDSNSTVTIRYTIPSSLVATAPATMPLWYFNEKTGLWQEEGQATRVGSYYIGTVKHFSFWNLDYPFAQARIKIRFTDNTGVPLQSTQVSLKATNGQVGFAYTDDKGVVEGIVPADQALTLKVIGQCQNTLYTHPQPIGPLGKDTDLGDIAINITAPMLTVTGKITDCNNNALKNVFVSAKIEGRTYRAYSGDDGKYTISVMRCNDTPSKLEISAIDPATNNGNTAEKTVTVNAENIDITVCQTAAQFVNIDFDGSKFTFGEQDSTAVSYTIYSVGNHSLSFDVARTNYSEYLEWRLRSNQAFVPGTYTLDPSFGMRFKGNDYFNVEGTCTITKIGSQRGDLVEGSISGTVCKDSLCTQRLPFSGTFKLPMNSVP
jgi:hypothetical protein